MEKLGIRIRGIYATALTRLFLDHGLLIADPTNVIKKRFQNEISEEAVPVVTVKDREDKQALIIVGSHTLAEKVIDVLRSEVNYLIIRKSPYELYSTYKVKVKARSERGYIVELPNGKGELLSSKTLSEGEEVVAHIVKADEDRPLLKQGGVITGLYIRAFEEGKHSFSHFIRDFEKKAILLSAASSSGLEGWGIRFRSYAGKVELGRILEDIKNVKNEIKKFRDEYERAKAPSLLRRGETLAFIILPFDAKRKMDELRRRQIPTVDLHHFYKANGGKISECLDLLERLTRTDDWKAILNFYLEEALCSIDGKVVEIRHERISEPEYKYRCEVTVLNDNILELRRDVRSLGVYDGLEIKREPGDVIESYTAPFSRVIIHRYISSKGETKGFYGNINTPLEISPQGFGWYLDLEVDVVYLPDSEAKVVDKEKLKKAYDRGMISKVILDNVYNYAEKVKDMFNNNMGPVDIIRKLLDISISPLKK